MRSPTWMTPLRDLLCWHATGEGNGALACCIDVASVCPGLVEMIPARGAEPSAVANFIETGYLHLRDDVACINRRI